MTIKTKKFIRCGLCIALDLAVIALISIAFYYFISIFENKVVTYFAFIALISLIVLLFVGERAKKTVIITLITLVPFVGVGIVIFYYLEGFYVSAVRNKTNTTSALNNAFKSFDTELAEFSKLSHYVDNRTGYPPLFSDKIEFYYDNCEYVSALIAEVGKAQKYVMLEFYIVEHGEALSRLETALYACLKRGVKVSLTVDYFGSGNYSKTESARALASAGAEIKMFKSPLLFAGLNFNARTHRKLAVIDGETGFVGGINFHNELVRTEKDCGLKVYGEPCKQIENMIFRLFGGSVKNEFKNENLGLGYIQLFSVSGKKTAENVFLETLATAKKEVLISTPYLSFGEEVGSMLSRLLLSGVRIKLLVPKKVSKAVWLINLNYANELLNKGAEVYFYNPKFLHEKLIIVDGKIALCGSLNFDIRSAEYQIESGVLLYESPVISEMATDFNLATANSEKGTQKICKGNLAENLMGRVLKLFGYFV